MKKEFHEIYDQLYSDYPYEIERNRPRRFHLDEFNFVMVIRRSIDKSDKMSNLRPDAKYFLLVNFHLLVVRPLIDNRPFRDNKFGINMYELENNIQQDVEEIVAEAIKNKREEEISGHKIMDVISGLWKKLRTTKLEIWG